MSEYKKNHTIPKFMLEYWSDKGSAFQGVHVYDINTKRYYISTGIGKKPFSFAITKDLYIHNSYSKRAVGLEKWFSQQENSLSLLIKQAHNKEAIKITSTFALTGILMGLTSLEYRSNYDINKILKAIENNKTLREQISASPLRPPEQLVLENIIHLVTEQHLEFIPTEMVFGFPPNNNNWVISDRPFFNDNNFEYRFVVLTNKLILGYRRSKAFTYNYIDFNEEFHEFFNKLIALNAREWLVAYSEREIKKYSSIYQTDEWKQKVINDKIIFKPIKYLSSGWTIGK